MPDLDAPDFPAVLATAEHASAQGQGRYVRLVAVRLVALVVAAAGGALTLTVAGVEVLGWLALLAFLVALGAEVLILALAPEKQWYEGRAVAESVKTVTWRYVSGGDPFGVARDRATAETEFRSQLRAIGRGMEYVPVADDQAVPASLSVARSEPFETRRERYLVARLLDQQRWYTAKARFNERRRTTFLVLTICLELAGLAAAATRVAGLIPVDLLGILSAVVGGAASWAQTKQYGQLSRAYAITANELGTVRSDAATTAEADWPRFVDEAEESISREHTLWQASRGVLPRPRPS